MEQADIIICWNHGGVPKGLVEANFQRPTKVIYMENPASWAHAVDKWWPYPVRGIIKTILPGVEPLRVAALGFSASCQGVAQLLNSQDGAALDAVVAIDGIHTGYVSGTKNVNPNGMKPWFEYGKLAIVNERLFAISHSSVVPPGYASTTETANYLWNTLTGNSPPFIQPALPELVVPATTVKVAAGPATGPARTVEYPTPPWKSQMRADGLVILGCKNLDVPRGTADHIYQAKAMLPLMLTAFLARRWNAIDPKAPGQSCFIAGPPPARDPFSWIGLGSCAASKVLPSDFVSTDASQKLPAVTPPAKASTTLSPSQPSSGSSLWPTIGLVGLATAGLWWMSSRQQLGLLRNPVSLVGELEARGWSKDLAWRELELVGLARTDRDDDEERLIFLEDPSGGLPTEVENIKIWIFKRSSSGGWDEYIDDEMSFDEITAYDEK
jgi:hypothetical protein